MPMDIYKVACVERVSSAKVGRLYFLQRVLNDSSDVTETVLEKSVEDKVKLEFLEATTSRK
jgi:hypothetical protein